MVILLERMQARKEWKNIFKVKKKKFINQEDCISKSYIPKEKQKPVS